MSRTGGGAEERMLSEGGHHVVTVDPMVHGFDKQQLEAELALLDPNEFPVASKILKAKLENCQYNVPTDPEYVTIDIHKPIRLCRKVVIPLERNPNFNYVGKIIGPGGKNLQALAQANKCRVVVCGKGTTKDPEKEQQLLASGDPKYAHYNDIPHVKIETIGGAVTAYERITNVFQQLEQILQPVMSPRQMMDDGSGKMVPAPANFAPPQPGVSPYMNSSRPTRGRGRAGGPAGGPRPRHPGPPARPPPSSDYHGHSGGGDYANGYDYSAYPDYGYGHSSSADYYAPPAKRSAPADYASSGYSSGYARSSASARGPPAGGGRTSTGATTAYPPGYGY